MLVLLVYCLKIEQHLLPACVLAGTSIGAFDLTRELAYLLQAAEFDVMKPGKAVSKNIGVCHLDTKWVRYVAP